MLRAWRALADSVVQLNRTGRWDQAAQVALVGLAATRSLLRAVGRRVQALLPSAGHFIGSYVARAIHETFGVDSLWPGVRKR